MIAQRCGFQQGAFLLTDPLHLTTTLQVLAWGAVAVVSTLIVASRKHYTVDVLIAW